MLGLSYCAGFFLVAASGGYSLTMMLRLLTAGASLVVEHGLEAASITLNSCGMWTQ